ncbi:hypothetical protein GC093_14685 [Paenibacillus sp. LMG 31456]|uniref:LTD domain-containing protein n=1 Tax=Paenibacillus foliorum TaxID=2654974 RepID=A0A972GU10_9BACL|nr:lamin tail domain-containing protein [Paenibacillus foliorum]NOU94454.1 hypothetical protein [Paenibacillus foliorum]
MKHPIRNTVAVFMLLALLFSGYLFLPTPQTTQAAKTDRLLITEIVPAPKSKGEAFEYVELYNPTDSVVDLTGHKIYYYEDMKSMEPWTSTVTKWDIVAMDEISGGMTNMRIQPQSTKIVWLIKKGFKGTVQQFNEEYGTTLPNEQFVYVQLGGNEGLIDDEQRYAAIVGPGGDQVKDRISMAAYNVDAGVGKCKYAPRPGERPCDFVRKEGQSAESVTFFAPAKGLDPETKMMERRIPYSIHQKPTPGSILPARSDDGSSDVLLITEVVPAPKTDGENYEYIELYNPTSSEVNLQGHKIFYYEDASSKEPWTSNYTKWDIIPIDVIAGGKTDMVIRPKSTKIVWLIKGNFKGTVDGFNKEYGTSLNSDQFVFVKLGSGQSLSNDQQRLIAIAGPDGDPVKDRISMVTYNPEAGNAKCKYVAKANEAACDFIRKANSSTESVNYFYPAGGLESVSRMMERRETDSTHQIPTPGVVLLAQVSKEPANARTKGSVPDSVAATGGGGAASAQLLITEVVPAPKTDGEHYEYIELYNPTDSEVDLTGYKIYYYEDMSSKQPWTSKVVKWDITAMDNIAGGKTDMMIQPKGTKVVWLIKNNFDGTLQDFNKEYDSTLNSDQFVFIKLSGGQGLANDQQRFLAIVGPDGDQVKDRISMIAYNQEAGTGKCKYVAKAKEAVCDFTRKANKSTESVNYYFPADGLDPVSRMMEFRYLDSNHQLPTPGVILPTQQLINDSEINQAVDSLLITEVVAAPKTEAEIFEYIELYNNSDKPIDLTGYKIYYNYDITTDEPWTSKPVRWNITASDKVSGSKTDMVIQPGSTKIVWLLKKQYGEVFSTQDFNEEYGSELGSDRFVYVKLGENEGLFNDIRGYLSIVAPRGHQVKDRVSTAAYNVGAGTGKCKYVAKEGEVGCDFVRKSDEVQESVIYFYPENGLDPVTKLMGRGNAADSIHQKPTPGNVLPEQVPTGKTTE